MLDLQGAVLCRLPVGDAGLANCLKKRCFFLKEKREPIPSEERGYSIIRLGGEASKKRGRIIFKNV